MSPAAKNVFLGISGGIAAYKTPELVRRLRDRGAEVQVVLTQSAREFVTETSLQAVSGRPIRSNIWDKEAEAAMGHIELARWADIVLIAPATAEMLSRLASGAAPDLLTTVCLATEAPLMIAPAMNRIMWANPAVQANSKTLEARGARILGPGVGSQACGEEGAGRMLEPDDIARQGLRGGRAARHGERQQQALRGHVAVLCFLGQGLGLLEEARGLWRQINLAGAAALDLGHLGERRFGGLTGLERVAPGGPDQVGGQTLRIVEQNLQQVFRRKTLVIAAQRQGLGGLNETAGPFGVLVEFHALSPLRSHPIGFGMRSTMPDHFTCRAQDYLPTVRIAMR